MWGLFTRSGKKPSIVDAQEVLDRVERLEIAHRRLNASLGDLVADHERLQERVSGHLGRILGGGAGRPRKGPQDPAQGDLAGETKDQFRARMQRAGMLTARIHTAPATVSAPGEADGQE